MNQTVDYESVSQSLNTYERAVNGLSMIEFVAAVMTSELILEGSARDGAVFTLDIAAADIREALEEMRKR